MDIRIESTKRLSEWGDVSVTVKQGDGRSAEALVFVVSDRFFKENKIGTGAIDEETLEALATEAGVHAAFKRGINILRYTSLSKKALAQRLREKGIAASDASAAVERLEFYRYIQEKNNALRVAQLAEKRGWGAARILREVRAKGYDSTACSLVESCLKHVDFESHAAAVIERRFGGYPEDEKERQRAYRLLVSYGYTNSEIKRAFAALKDGDIESLGRRDMLARLSL